MVTGMASVTVTFLAQEILASSPRKFLKTNGSCSRVSTTRTGSLPGRPASDFNVGDGSSLTSTAATVYG